MSCPPSAFLAPLVSAPSGTISAVALLLPDTVGVFCRETKRRVLVGEVNGVPIRRAVRSLGDGRWGIAIGKTFLADIRASEGDIVAVELDYDADPDAILVPAELVRALGAARMRALFDALPPVEQRRACMSVERGRTDAVRTRRAQSVLDGLA